MLARHKYGISIREPMGSGFLLTQAKFRICGALAWQARFDVLNNGCRLSPSLFMTSATPDPDLSDEKNRTSILVVHNPDDLREFIPEWEDLAASALEPNVFYE